MSTGRLRSAWKWRLGRLIEWRDGFFARMPAQLRIHTRWPWPIRKPWQQARLTCVSYGGGVGDELMCTAVFREIRRRNPACRITFLSRFPELFAGNPHCAVERRPASDDDVPSDALWLTYGPAIPPRRSLPAMLGECAGLILTDIRPDPPLVEASSALREEFAQIGSPRVVIQPLTSRWSPNKNWPREHWRALIPMLTERFEVVEAGNEPLFSAGESQAFGPRFHSLAGATSVTDFAWIVSQASVFIGPDSAGMHLAAAYGIPTVAIFGGYQAPSGVPYPEAVPFFSPEPCAPCWLSTGCPYDLRCQQKIAPAAVFSAACSQAAK